MICAICQEDLEVKFLIQGGRSPSVVCQLCYNNEMIRQDEKIIKIYESQIKELRNDLNFKVMELEVYQRNLNKLLTEKRELKTERGL